MPPYLEVLREAETEMVPLEGLELTVGRGPANDVVVDDQAVSRRHAVLQRLAAGWAIEDLGSKNGTLVNGQLVDQARPLYSGDEILVGDTVLIYHSGDLR